MHELRRIGGNIDLYKDGVYNMTVIYAGFLDTDSVTIDLNTLSFEGGSSSTTIGNPHSTIQTLAIDKATSVEDFIALKSAGII